MKLRKRVRPRLILRYLIEEFLTAVLVLIPRALICRELRKKVATIYGCRTDEIFLYKSGRSAIHGLARELIDSSSEYRIALVPDYVCNVVPDALKAAGLEVEIYRTDALCMPLWNELEKKVAHLSSPIIVLVSQFGTVPATRPEVTRLRKANNRAFFIADECQNLLTSSNLRPLPDQAIIFSFNNKTCPGVMGGGVVQSKANRSVPLFTRPSILRHLLCSIALIRLWLFQNLKLFRFWVRIAKNPHNYHFKPSGVEYSRCKRPHYDLEHESIYKISATRALVSMIFLKAHIRERAERIHSLMTGLRDIRVCNSHDVMKTVPPYIPISPTNEFMPEEVVAPTKGPYGDSNLNVNFPRPWIALKANTPGIEYSSSSLAVVQLTTRHKLTDNRILNGMGVTAKKGGFRSIVMGPGTSSGVEEEVELRAIPNLSLGKSRFPILLSIRVFAEAIFSRFHVIQIHDPDLLPAALMLKLFGRRVIYDVHDDYEASILDRLHHHPRLARWLSRVWWWFEQNAARRVDGVIVADRHLASKFSVCHPVILGNYPRLNFTAPTRAHVEKTFNLIYVGGVTRERGVEIALQALRMLSQPDLRLHIIGTGNDLGLMEDLRTEPRVVLHGRVPWTELHRFYEKAHVGLALYQPLDSFMYCPGENAVKIMEYMAAGIPVVCSDFPGLKAFVEDTGVGLSVKPDDPEAVAAVIQRLIEDDALRKKLGVEGRRRFEAEYHWEKHEGKLIELYKRVLAA